MSIPRKSIADLLAEQRQRAKDLAEVARLMKANDQLEADILAGRALDDEEPPVMPEDEDEDDNQEETASGARRQRKKRDPEAHAKQISLLKMAVHLSASEPDRTFKAKHLMRHIPNTDPEKSSLGALEFNKLISKRLYHLRKKALIAPAPNNTGDRHEYRWQITPEGIEASK